MPETEVSETRLCARGKWIQPYLFNGLWYNGSEHFVDQVHRDLWPFTQMGTRIE